MNYGVGIATFLGAVVLLVKVNGVLSIFWDLPTFLFVVIGSVALLVANKSLSEIKEFGVEVRVYLVRSLERVGSIGVIIGFIQMLQNFSDPKSIGPAMAVCLLSILYSQIFINLIRQSDVSFKNLTPLSTIALAATVGSYFIILLAL